MIPRYGLKGLLSREHLSPSLINRSQQEAFSANSRRAWIPVCLDDSEGHAYSVIKGCNNGLLLSKFYDAHRFCEFLAIGDNLGFVFSIRSSEIDLEATHGQPSAPAFCFISPLH